MSDYYTLLTDAGRLAFANAALAGESLEVTHIAVGDGEALPDESRTELQNEIWRGGITRLSLSESDENVLECDTRIPPEDGGWTVREVGLFDADGVLLAVGNVPASEKPALASGSGKDMQIRMHIFSSNADVVTVKIDPAIIMASQAWVTDILISRDLAIAQAKLANVQTALKVNALEQSKLEHRSELDRVRTDIAELIRHQIIISDRASRAILS